MSDSFYDQNAAEFFSSTAHIDASSLYEDFLPLIPKGGSILDAGCGSGRDALAFKLRGFQVEAFDASASLAALAQILTTQQVDVCRFLEYQSDKVFDGIWACASLLHLPYGELASNITHLARFLSPGGHFYCSFKYGEGELERDGRHFTNLTETGLDTLLADTPLCIAKQWKTSDMRPGREHEKWLNGILRHKD